MSCNDVMHTICLKQYDTVSIVCEYLDDLGQIKHYEYDEANPEAEPIVTIVSNKWHVDLRLRTANDLLDEHSVVVKTPIHNFS